MQFTLKPFHQLSLLELFNIYKLRSQVFVVEQNCPYQDPDEKDPAAFHILMLQGEELAGYARILPPGLSYAEPGIGRVVVQKHYRGQQAGQLLMKQCLSTARQLYKDQDIVISAQSYLLRFYTRLGFVAEGPEYLEDNIPHIQMRFRAGT